MGLRKLTKYDVQRIFELFATGNHTPEDIAQEFGVSGIYVGQLLRKGGRGDTNIDERLKTIGKQASKGCYARLDLAPQAEEPEDFFEQLKTALGLIDIESMLIDYGLLIRHPEGIKKLVLTDLFGGEE